MDGGRVLIADADPGSVKVLGAILTDAGFQVRTAACAATALRVLEVEEVDAIVSDLHLPGSDGLALIREATGVKPEIPVIVLSSCATGDLSAWVIDRGAWGYFRKPPDYSLLKGMISRAVKNRRLGRQLQALQQRLRWQELRQQTGSDMEPWSAWGQALEAGREAKGNLLIEAEVGIGRRRLAHALHLWRTQGKHPFHLFDCLSGELIFKERRSDGAVSSALQSCHGAGTVYLREPGTLRFAGQLRLLEMLRQLPPDCRVISSSRLDLASEAEAGRFSTDLLARLAEQTIRVPPLRHRPQEVAWLAWKFLRKVDPACRPSVLAADAVQALCEYSWPGNDRQLEAAMIQASTTAAGGKIRREHLPGEILAGIGPLSGPPTLRQMESLIIREALEKSGGNKSHAARMLGLSRKTLYKRLREIDGSAAVCTPG